MDRQLAWPLSDRFIKTKGRCFLDINNNAHSLGPRVIPNDGWIRNSQDRPDWMDRIISRVHAVATGPGFLHLGASILMDSC